MRLDLSEFVMNVATSLKFHRYRNMLCFDIFSEIEEFTLLVEQS